MEGRRLLLLIMERMQPLMTDAKALATIRQFTSDYPDEPTQASVNIRFTGANQGVVIAQRTGGELPAVVRSAPTFGEAVNKLFQDTRYADQSS